MVKLSKRLLAAASMVSEDSYLADVGTDHGYVPIYLMQQGKISGAVAMDISEGPLSRAKAHIAQYGLDTYIRTRRSDGVAALSVGEADSILAAGMGGALIVHILTDGEAVCRAAKELILQPQSELRRVRLFLAENGYETLAEDMVLEDGKFYPMMKVRYAGGAREMPEVALRYGGLLLINQNPTLKLYLEKEKAAYEKIRANLRRQKNSEKSAERLPEVEETLRINEEAYERFEPCQ